MTASQDFNFDQQSGELGQPSYPVVFGVSLNPKNISIAVAVLGVLGGVYMILNMVRIPRTNMLAAHSWVDENGNYVKK